MYVLESNTALKIGQDPYGHVGFWSASGRLLVGFWSASGSGSKMTPAFM
jgi:hypothetical protein